MKEEVMINRPVPSGQHEDVDYTLTHVPTHAQKHWVAIFSVLLGFTFIVTTMAAAAGLSTSFYLADLIKIVIIGNIILCLYVAVLCAISARTGLNSILLARYAMGMIGSKWASIILGGTQVVWYAFQASYMGRVFALATGWEEYLIPITIFWSLLMGATAIRGTKGMEIVAYLAIPPFLYLTYKIPAISIDVAGGVKNLFAIEPTTSMTFAAAITIIIGSFVSGGTQAPNWARFAKSPKTAFFAGFFAFFIGNVVMAFSGMLGGPCSPRK